MKLPWLDLAALSQSPAVRVWRHRNFAIFMSGLAPYYITGWIQRVAVGWLAWELSYSYAWVGAIAAADLAPMMFLGPFAGAIVDRTDPMRMMRWAQLIMTIEALIMAIVTLTGLMTVELLFVLALITGAIQPLYTAGRQTIVPSSVPRQDFPSAVSLDSTLFHGSRFIGPMLAAIIIAWGSVGMAFLVHVAGCLMFYIQVCRLDLKIDRSNRSQESVISDIKAGFLYVRNHTGMWSLFWLLFVASVVARPLQDLLPGFAGAVFMAGPSGLAWLTSSMGVGSLLASLVLATRGHVRGLTRMAILSSGMLGITTFLFVSTTTLWVAIIIAIAWAFALTMMGVAIQTMTQIAVSDAMRGRVMILVAMLYRGVPALGAVLIGAAAELVGLRLSFTLSAVICVVAWLMLARRTSQIDTAMARRD